MLRPIVGVVGDDVVGAVREAAVEAATYSRGVPGVAAANVGMSCGSAGGRVCGCPVAPAVAVGALESAEGGGCSFLRLLGVVTEVAEPDVVHGKGVEKVRSRGATTAKPMGGWGGVGEDGESGVAAVENVVDKLVSGERRWARRAGVVDGGEVAKKVRDEVEALSGASAGGDWASAVIGGSDPTELGSAAEG